MTGLMPIGVFARATRLSVRVLRNYDRLGLLVPAWVDPDTGYRRYDVDQFPRAGLVRRLRVGGAVARDRRDPGGRHPGAGRRRHRAAPGTRGRAGGPAGRDRRAVGGRAGRAGAGVGLAGGVRTVARCPAHRPHVGAYPAERAGRGPGARVRAVVRRPRRAGDRPGGAGRDPLPQRRPRRGGIGGGVVRAGGPPAPADRDDRGRGTGGLSARRDRPRGRLRRHRDRLPVTGALDRRAGPAAGGPGRGALPRPARARRTHGRAPYGDRLAGPTPSGPPQPANQEAR